MTERSPLQAAIVERIEQGEAQRVAEQPFLPIFGLSSGTQFGFDGDGHWVLHGAGQPGLRRLAEGSESHFLEWVEQPREEIETAVSDGAAECGLPVDLVVASFPAVQLVAALIASRNTHGCRLALKWLLPSELRPLRGELAELAADRAMPNPIRDLAAHLVVPE
jgi:hypothetical protein